MSISLIITYAVIANMALAMPSPSPQTTTTDGSSSVTIQHQVQHNITDLDDPIIRSREMRKRAREMRKALLRQKIENALNIVGKKLPSVDEVLEPDDIANAAKLWESLDKNHSIESPAKVINKKDTDAVSVTETSSSVPFAPMGGHENVIEDYFTDYTEKIKSIVPQCTLPEQISSDVITPPHVMHLIFDLGKTRPEESNHSVSVARGKLKLFFKKKDETCISASCDKLRITVSWIKRIRHKHNHEFEILDSAMVPIDSVQWIEFDVLAALKKWFKRPRKNFGFFIEVEDLERNRINVESVIRNVNCNASVSVVLPSVITEQVTEADLDNTANVDDGFLALINTDRNPTLDISTIETANFYDQVQYSTTSPAVITDESSSTESATFPDKDDDASESEDDDENDTAVTESSIFDLPLFHNIHIRHRLPQRKPSNNPSSTSTVPTTTTTTSEITKGENPVFNRLETLEHIDYGRREQSVLYEPTSVHPSVPTHPRAPSMVFRPTNRKMIMTHTELLYSIKEMLARQQGEIDAEKKFLDALLKEV